MQDTNHSGTRLSALNPLGLDFLGGPVVKNLPYNAGDEGSPLVRELRSHAVGLSAHAPTTEPVGHS